jgi:hypothetical protein
MFDNGYQMIRLLHRMDRNGSVLHDYGNGQPLLLDNDPRDEFPRETVETLCELGFLRTEQGTTADKRRFIEYKVTDKTLRLLERRKARETEEADLRSLKLAEHFWIVAVEGEVFIDLGITPPDLWRLTAREWADGERVVVTCNDPNYVLASHLRLALATTVYDGLTNQQIDDIERIATTRNREFKGSMLNEPNEGGR